MAPTHRPLIVMADRHNNSNTYQWEPQEQRIGRKKEQQELETMLAESAAKLAVLQAFDSWSNVSYAMNSHLEREIRNVAPVNRLDRLAKELNTIPPSRPQQLLLPAATTH